MISSGQLALVRNDDLRDAIANWEGLLQDHEESQSLLVDEITLIYDPWLRTQTVFSRRGLQSQHFAPDYSGLMSSVRFENELLALVDRSQAIAREVQALKESAVSITRLLESEL
jgi:hypothetical protein